MNRRRFIRGLVGAAVCPICARILAGTALAVGDGAPWSYEGSTAPDSWAKLHSSYAACGTGTQQSPIDLSGAIGGKVSPPSIHWQVIRLDSVENNGHTIQVNTTNAGHIEQDGAQFNLVQFHFHHMSEHTVDGVQFPMELHFVHQAANGKDLAVVGVFIVEGKKNKALEPIWSLAPSNVGKASGTETVDAQELLPKSNATFRYYGSLTTPPCSETVSWSVYNEPITASGDQIAVFRKLFPNNFRPIQPLNRRFLLFGG